jgi:hypothetical protein
MAACRVHIADDILHLLFRLRNRGADVPRFLYDPTAPFTNNLAKQDGRMMKVKQKISGGFRSDAGAEDFGTIHRQKAGMELASCTDRGPADADRQTALRAIRARNLGRYCFFPIGQSHMP